MGLIGNATQADYEAHLLALRPPGPAWAPEDDHLGAAAEECARVHNRAVALVDEADPRTTTELLTDWERVAGLPDACTAGQTMSIGPGSYNYPDERIAAFSRASTASYVDGGVIKYAAVDERRRENGQLLIEGYGKNVIANTHTYAFNAVVSAGVSTAPDGTTAYKVVPNAGAVTNPYRGAVGVQKFALEALVGQTRDYSFSGYFSPFGPLNYQAYLILSANNGWGDHLYAAVLFNATTGTFSAKALGAGWSELTAPAAEMMPCGMWRVTWALRFTQQAVPRTIVYHYFTIRDHLGAPSYTADGLSGIQYACMQFEEGAAPTSYIETTTTTAERAADVCSIYTEQTLQERRAALVARLTGIGGQSRAYFIALAASLGYTVTITEYRPYHVNSHVNDPLNSELWNFVWQVNAALDTVRRFTVNAGVNEPLASWGNTLLECVIRRLAPAHTKVLFAYS